MKSILIFLTFSFLALTTANIFAAPPSQNSPVHQLNSRMRNQQLLLQKGIRSGKLTKEQAETMWANIKAARTQEVAFFRKNGHHQLTAEQQSQLNASLNNNSSALGESPSTISSN